MKGPVTSSLTVMILFKDELILASEALQRFKDAQESDITPEQRAELIATAMQACYGALHNLHKHKGDAWMVHDTNIFQGQAKRKPVVDGRYEDTPEATQ